MRFGDLFGFEFGNIDWSKKFWYKAVGWASRSCVYWIDLFQKLKLNVIEDVVR